jgi:hypothetical protein
MRILWALARLPFMLFRAAYVGITLALIKRQTIRRIQQMVFDPSVAWVMQTERGPGDTVIYKAHTHEQILVLDDAGDWDYIEAVRAHPSLPWIDLPASHALFGFRPRTEYELDHRFGWTRVNGTSPCGYIRTLV